MDPDRRAALRAASGLPAEATVYAAPHTVACPTCSARPGHPCVRPSSGTALQVWHRSRESAEVAG